MDKHEVELRRRVNDDLRTSVHVVSDFSSDPNRPKIRYDTSLGTIVVAPRLIQLVRSHAKAPISLAFVVDELYSAVSGFKFDSSDDGPHSYGEFMFRGTPCCFEIITFAEGWAHNALKSKGVSGNPPPNERNSLPLLIIREVSDV